MGGRRNRHKCREHGEEVSEGNDCGHKFSRFSAYLLSACATRRDGPWGTPFAGRLYPMSDSVRLWPSKSRPLYVAALFLTAIAILAAKSGAVKWEHLSSATGALPVPGTSTEQTGDLVARLDPKSRATDFLISFRVVAPALVWYRRNAQGWDRYVIEKDFLTMEAGGAAFDIDGDGDLDIVWGEDSQGDRLWWWENPYPTFDPNVSWRRHLIKSGGAHQHHDQIFADFKGTGKAQLVYWNQGAKTLFLADIPDDPRRVENWPATAIFSGQAGEGVEGRRCTRKASMRSMSTATAR